MEIEATPILDNFLFKKEELELFIKDYFEAEREWMLRTKQQHDDPFAWSMLGMIQVHLEKYSSAIKHLTTALELDPAEPKYYDQLGFAYACQGNNLKAVDYYKQSLQKDYHRLKTLERLCQSCKVLGKVEEEQKYLEELIELDEDNEYALEHLGKLHYYQDNYPQAILYFSELIRLQPDNYELHLKLGNVYFYVKNLAEACRYYQKMIKLDNSKVIGWKILIKLFLENYQFKMGLATLQGARKLFPNSQELEILANKYQFLAEILNKPVYLDGSNIAYNGCNGTPILAQITQVVSQLKTIGFKSINIITSSALWRSIDDKEIYETMRRQGEITQASKGIDDDLLIISSAIKTNGLIVTNDDFINHTLSPRDKNYVKENIIRFQFTKESLHLTLLSNNFFLS